MSLGVHFALAGEDLALIRDCADRDAFVELLTKDIEERYLDQEEWSFESDKAWDAIHRCLTDGRLLYASGPVPPRVARVRGAGLRRARGAPRRGPPPFGGGHRRCLGAAFAVYEMKVVLAAILGAPGLVVPSTTTGPALMAGADGPAAYFDSG